MGDGEGIMGDDTYAAEKLAALNCRACEGKRVVAEEKARPRDERDLDSMIVGGMNAHKPHTCGENNS